MSNLDLLKEQLQDNLVTYLDGIDNTIVDEVCNIVINTINEFKVG